MLPGRQDMRTAAARAEQTARAAAEAEAKRCDGDLWKSVRKMVGSRAFQARCIGPRHACCGQRLPTSPPLCACCMHVVTIQIPPTSPPLCACCIHRDRLAIPPPDGTCCMCAHERRGIMACSASA